MGGKADLYEAVIKDDEFAMLNRDLDVGEELYYTGHIP